MSGPVLNIPIQHGWTVKCVARSQSFIGMEAINYLVYEHFKEDFALLKSETYWFISL